MRSTISRSLCMALALAAGCAPQSSPEAPTYFEQVIVDSNGPLAPWGKSVGDINGDGRPDIVVGGHDNGGLAWYENPQWRKHYIAEEGSFGTDYEIADIDNDGRNDVIALMDDRIVWFKNHGDGWQVHEIDGRRQHDIEIGDVDGDGLPDLVTRGQSAFGNSGNQVYVYFQEASGAWKPRIIEAPEGEGLKLFDIDEDGRPDIVLNGAWLANPARREGEWMSHRFSRSWEWPHTFIAIGDVNDDGRPDIAMSPAEPSGSRYRISWFEAPTERTLEWKEHIVDPDVEAVHHFVGIADFDMDGHVDISSSMMHQGAQPQEVKVYFRRGAGQGWDRHVLSDAGSHSMRVFDADGDGDADLFGANWDGDDQRVKLWVNTACNPESGCPCWKRHAIDNERPGRAVFVDSADIDGDGLSDVASGAWWYRNPGRLDGVWERQAVGSPELDLALLADLDGDGDADVLATSVSESGVSRFAFAENDGRGRFALHADVAPGAGDFLQGVALARFGGEGTRQVALSWHEAGHGIELLSVPVKPSQEKWNIARISDVSQDEALSAGDIDRDGRTDLLLGTRWLRNEADGQWSDRPIDPERNKPDRNRLADIDGDGRLDAVVGFEAISVPGEVVWYEQAPDLAQPWERHLVGSITGPMSLSVIDMDGDGDLDIIAGEHDLDKPETARLVFFENVDRKGGSWRMHTLHTGDEHHDGAVAVDIDGDRDVDILSIGWGHSNVLLYENVTKACGRS